LFKFKFYYSMQFYTFKLSATLSNINRFSKCLHCWSLESVRNLLENHTTLLYPPHLRHDVATLPLEIKKSNFLQIFSRWRKMKTNSILSAPIFGRPFVKRFALCYHRFVVCLSVLPVCPVCPSVTFVHCGQTVGRIKTKKAEMFKNYCL